MPVVENLRDMWKVTKLQQERKAKQEREKALQELEDLKAASEPPQVSEGPPCSWHMQLNNPLT